MKRPAAVLVLLLLLGTGAASYIAVQRELRLASHPAVEIVLDHRAALILAAELGYSFADFVGELADAGVTALGISEVSFEDLPFRPGVSVMEGYQLLAECPLVGTGDLACRLQAAGLLEPWHTCILASDRGFAEFLAGWARRRLGPDRAELVALPQAAGYMVVLRGVPTVNRPDPRRPDEERRLPELRFGFWPGDLAEAADLGLGVVAVVHNDRRLGPEDIRALLEPLRGKPELRAVHFAAGKALGHPDRERLRVTAGLFRDWGLVPALMRDEAQEGVEVVAAAVGYQGIKLRQVLTGRPAAEYADAVSERGTRGLYLAPAAFPGPPTATLDGNRAELERLVAALEKVGYHPGAAQPLAAYQPPVTALALAGAAVAAAGWLAAGLLWPRRLARWPVAPVAMAATVVAAAAIAAWWPGPGREGLALLSAVIFPTWGTLAVVGWHRGVRREGRLLLRGLAGVLIATALAVAGGLLVGGLLGETAYVLEVRLFRGVKLAHGLPLLLVAAALLAPLGRGRRLLGRELTVGDFAVAVGLAAAAVVYLVRTGNEPLVAPGGAELALREALERVLVVRPRLKEFLLGHPALLLMPLAALKRRGAVLTGLALAATVGQVSVINSFAHLHTPAALTLLRTAWGLIFGVAVGLVGFALLTWRRGTSPYAERG